MTLNASIYKSTPLVGKLTRFFLPTQKKSVPTAVPVNSTTDHHTNG